MDMQFYGANTIVLSSKSNRVVIDDNLSTLGAKSVIREGDICLFTGEHAPVTAKPKIILDMPGEYEVSNVSIFGLQTRAHMDEEGTKRATMYKITWGEVKILVVGHVFPKLSEAQLEAIGIIDVMFVPVGGNGYTTDATGALQLIKQVEPKVAIPTHYNDANLHYEVPQAELSDALKTMGMEPKDAVAKFQFKPLEVSDTTQLVVLETSK
jgi:hypothetical protein